MKNIILTSMAAGSLTVLLAGPTLAQSPPATNDAGATAFTAKNVSRIRPFGSINVYNVGMDLAHVSPWVKTLSPAEKQEMVGRCSVIIQNQQTYYAETTTFCQNFAIAVAESVSASSNTRP